MTGLAWLMVLAAAAADPASRSADDRPLFPEEVAPGWKRSGREQVFARSDLFNRIDGAAELFLEMGYRELAVQRYARAEERLEVEVYRMDSATGAFGLYLHKRGPETPLPGLAVRHTGNRFQITGVKGRHIVQVLNPAGREESLPTMVALAGQVLAGLPDDRPEDLLKLLPAPDLQPGSELLFCGPYSLQPVFTLGPGDILQQGGRTFGVAGDYRLPDGELSTRMIVPYPDKEQAEKAWRWLREHLDSQLRVVQESERVLIFQDSAGKFGQVRRQDNRLELAVRLPRPPLGE